MSEQETEKTTRTVEIGGVKVDVDLRYAVRRETHRIGDKVKVLIKSPFGNDFSVHAGVIVGFEPFKELPTIVVCYLDSGYDCGVKFLYLNKDSKHTEMVAAVDDDLKVNKEEVITRMDRKIAEAQAKVEDAEQAKAYFLARFGRWFNPVMENKTEQEEV